LAAASSSSSLAADRYAKALFELAQEENVLDPVAGDLEGIATLIAESEDLSRLVKSPIYSREQQAASLPKTAACSCCPRSPGSSPA
jgi:F-type H+-transporting ATPase subunit delta